MILLCVLSVKKAGLKVSWGPARRLSHQTAFSRRDSRDVQRGKKTGFCLPGSLLFYRPQLSLCRCLAPNGTIVPLRPISRAAHRGSLGDLKTQFTQSWKFTLPLVITKMFYFYFLAECLHWFFSHNDENGDQRCTKMTEVCVLFIQWYLAKLLFMEPLSFTKITYCYCK